MKAQKSMKRFASLLLALVMVFAMSGTALASETKPLAHSGGDDGITGSITIDGYAGEEYSIYQIFDMTYADDYSAYSYTVVSPWETFLTNNYSDYFTLVTVDGIIYLDPSSKIFDDDAGGLDMAAFARAALTWAQENSISPTAGPTAATANAGAEPDPDTGMTEGSVTFSNLNLGYYLVSSSVGTLCSLDSTTPDVTINDKNTTPVIHKYLADSTDGESFDSDNDGVDDRQEDDADNHDTIRYELIIDNVDHVKELVVHDYMDEEQLAIGTIQIESIYLYKSADDTTGTDISSSCTYTTDTCGGEKCGFDGCTFEIDIPTEILSADDVTSTAFIKIVYNIQLTEELEDFEDDLDKIANHAVLTFGASGVGVPDEVDTYSYGFKIYKYTGDLENEEDTALANAEFILQNESGQYAKFTLDNDSGIYLFDSWVNTQSEGTTLVSDAEGIIHMDGLNEGTYTVTETKAPDGYNMLKDSITVTITPDENRFDSFTVNGSYDHQVNIENNQGSILPGTGGIGTTIFYVVGAILVIGAAVLLITRRRMNRQS